jgi:hypothetical protein
MESYGENDLDADSEHLFVEIISPVATVLDGMKPDDKLIIVAPEVCTQSTAMLNLGLGVWFLTTAVNSRHAALQSFMLSKQKYVNGLLHIF